MVNQPLGREPGHTSLQEGGVTDVQGLVRHLAQQVANGVQTPALYEPDGGLHEVILDVEVDGTRYRLVRSHPRSSETQVQLSPRETEIARMVAKGYPNKTIAAVLDISPWTVCTYLRRIFAKLSVGSRAAMVARLLEEGLMREHKGHA